MKLIFATSSEHKFSEASRVFPELSRVDIDLPEIQAADHSIVVSAKLDAAVAAQYDQVLVEDSGLALECLHGLPGPFTKFFLAKLGANGIFDVASKVGNLRACAVTVAACSINGQKFQARGEVHGTIVAPRGTGGFGFDPIFMPDGLKKTFAELSNEDKCEISHRGRAMQSLRSILKQAFANER